VSFSVKENFTENSTYAGSNAFGVTKDITKTRSKKFGVFFSERNFDSAVREAGAKRPEDELVALLPVPLSTEKARANPKDNVALLIQYRWVPDYLSTSWDSHSPTIDEPYENHTSGEYLKAKPTRFVVFNKLTGEILLSKATP